MRAIAPNPDGRLGGVFFKLVGFSPSLGVAGAYGPFVDNVGLQIDGKYQSSLCKIFIDVDEVISAVRRSA